MIVLYIRLEIPKKGANGTNLRRGRCTVTCISNKYDLRLKG